jgi:hypothetical protein
VGIYNVDFALTTTINLKGNPNAMSLEFTYYDYLVITGSKFGGNVTTTMIGPNARIDVDNGITTFNTLFDGKFIVTMTGKDPTVNLSAGTGPGYTDIDFTQGAKITGASGNGGVIKYNPFHVTGAIIPKYFGLLLV